MHNWSSNTLTVGGGKKGAADCNCSGERGRNPASVGVPGMGGGGGAPGVTPVGAAPGVELPVPLGVVVPGVTLPVLAELL